MNNSLWYEVWVDEGLNPPYVLLLLADNDDHGFQIYDLMEKTIALRTSSYEAAQNWLLEDEYTQVGGRMPLE